MTQQFRKLSTMISSQSTEPVILLLVLCAFASPSLAAPVNHGDFTGSNVAYKQVTESSFSGDGDVLFGAPQSTSDVLDFDPVGFSAQSQFGGADLTSSQLSMSIEAGPSRSISKVLVSDGGDVSLVGLGSNSTQASVSGTVIVTIQAVDGVNIVPIQVPGQLTYSPANGTYRLMSEGGGGPLFMTTWTGTRMIDINQQLKASGVPFINGATRLALAIDAGLIATSEATASAQIDRKDFAVAASARTFGDYDDTGLVDAGDYVAWRKGLGTDFVESQYDNWKAHFGNSIAPASAPYIPEGIYAVPEPSTWLNFSAFFAAVVWYRCRRSARSRPQVAFRESQPCGI